MFALDIRGHLNSLRLAESNVSDAYDACAGDGRSVGKRGRL